MEKPTIRLFGTWNKSTWRNDFINEYQKSNINYFNPQSPKGTWRAPKFYADSYALKDSYELVTEHIKKHFGSPVR